MKIAIVGAGVSGLVAAYRLSDGHEIVVFEANDYPGGHTNTVEVAIGEETHAVDTGFIVFNDWTYPNFIKLIDELGVASQPTEMSFSVQDERTGLEYNGHSLNTLFAQRSNLLRPSFYRMLADILRFGRESVALVDDAREDLTVADFLATHRYSREFRDHYLIPMGSAIWSCPRGTFSQFPIRFVVEFYRNHGLLSVRRRPTWRTIQGGSQTYVKAMTKRFSNRIRLRTPVLNVRRSVDAVQVSTREGIETFDHVVFACHSDQALRMLGADATPTERELLSAFPYTKNTAVLHTDVSRLPKSRRAWASWNYRLADDPQAPATVTYNMNILQRLKSRHTFCVTLNDDLKIAPSSVLRRFEYEHPVFTTRRAEAQSRRRELLVANRSSYCGAYWKNGFHEDGVTSAIEVVDALQAGPNTARLAVGSSGRAT
ncbi:MAG TPA: FAD-dependent oxidoreductase [Pirellulales bacterium]